MADDLHYRALSDLSRATRDGSLTAVELVEHHLQRIAQLDTQLHAFAEVRVDAARAEARAADHKRARGEPLGPLHGVPIAVKDLCAMAGTRTGAGGFFATGFTATQTATVVQRLQDAGAIIIGKAQLTEGAWASHHPDVAAPVNPWSPHRWSGASSSGSGVAVSAGFAAGSIGTDTAGSIRFPSACNGLVGLKPTWGRVSRHGVFPLSDTFDHVGPMARSVLDVALMFAAIAGADPADPTALDLPQEDWPDAAMNGTLAGTRIGVDPHYAQNGLDEATSAAFAAALDVLRQQGAEIVELRVPPVNQVMGLLLKAAFVEAAISHAPTYPKEKAKYGPDYAALLEVGRAASAVDYATVAIWRREFTGQLGRLFQSVNMLAVPVMPVVPPTTLEMQALGSGDPLGGAALTRFTIPFNAAGVPCLTLPMQHAADGTPLGFQLVGPALGERALLAAGTGYERATRFDRAHPSL
jgi:amidase